jgi:2-oxoisovalerate dehydrogenase E1 component
MPQLPKGKLQYKKGKHSNAKLVELYRGMLRPRMIEEKMLILLRQGKISKWFSGIGQEAISVGATMALDEDEMIFPMHRNLGVFTSRNIPLYRLFCQWQGKASGFTTGRDRSFHFGAPDFNVVGMISHLGPQLALASGVALAHKLRKDGKIALAFTGEGGTSEGDFHEALNVASVWQLPVIFVIENNGYGLSTPSEEQYRCKDLADRAIGYGMQSSIIDGNNVLDVHNEILAIAKKIKKNPQPWLVECKTFRMRGHEEASGTKYVPKKLMDAWAKKDPLENFEKFLLKSKVLTKSSIEEMRAEIKAEINEHLEKAYSEDEISSTELQESQSLHSPATTEVVEPRSEKTKELRMIDSISQGLDQGMKKHKKLICMGQDIADYGGVFKITDGFMDKYGKDRVRNTPLCESAIIGIGIGLSLRGYKSMIEMQFADFVTCGFNQIVNNAAKLHYRWGHSPDMVIRMPTGGSVGAGPFHSQTNEAWFTHTPGLKVVYPSNPLNAKGLLLAALADPNPVLFFEHKALYRSMKQDVPNSYYTTEIGKAEIARSGSTATIVTYGLGVKWATDLVEQENLDVEIIDLLSLAPIDYDTIETSIKKTNRVLLLHEDVLVGGIGGEISAHISEHLFEYLDAPVMRVASLNTPVPFAKNLEKLFLPLDRLKVKLSELLNY